MFAVKNTAFIISVIGALINPFVLTMLDVLIKV